MRIEDCEMYTAADNRGMSIRENLAELMRQRRMNPHSLAAATGVKQPTIYRILEGESLTPRDATLQPLASYFDTDRPWGWQMYRNMECQRPRQGNGWRQ